MDNLPSEGDENGTAFRDLAWEQEIHKMTQDLGIGAQFGGEYRQRGVRAKARTKTRVSWECRQRGLPPLLGSPLQCRFLLLQPLCHRCTALPSLL